jgi:hypothetical protein
MISTDAAAVGHQTKLLNTHGVQDVRWRNGSWSGKDMARVFEQHLQAIPSDHYLMTPDVDELYEYPCHLDLEKEDAWCAHMRDALAPDGMLADPTSNPSLEQQFPRWCYVRQHVRRDLTVQKPTLLRATSLKRGARRRMEWPHKLLGEQCKRTGWFAHLTMTRDQLALAERKAADKAADKLASGFVYYQRMHAFLLKANSTNVINHPFCRPNGFLMREQYWPPCGAAGTLNCTAE